MPPLGERFGNRFRQAGSNKPDALPRPATLRSESDRHGTYEVRKILGLSMRFKRSMSNREHLTHWAHVQSNTDYSVSLFSRQ